MNAASRFSLLIAVLFACHTGAQAADCRKVGPVDSVVIDPVAASKLAEIGIDRAKLFASIAQISETETSGCWGGATGDFDDQLVSVGALQWNYGKKSLPRRLRLFRARLGDQFDAEKKRLAKNHGDLIFSSGCLKDAIDADCTSAIRALLVGKDLPSSLKADFDALFESDAMIQIQMDAFVALVGSVRDDLKRMFPQRIVTPRQIQWAIDSKVQMENPFPSDKTIARFRATWGVGKVQPGAKKERAACPGRLV